MKLQILKLIAHNSTNERSHKQMKQKKKNNIMNVKSACICTKHVYVGGMCVFIYVCIDS